MELRWRDWRWLGVAEQHVVFAAADDAGWTRLATEAVVMARFRARAGPVVPKVLHQDRRARVQVRERADGTTGHDAERLVFGDAMPAGAADRYRDDCPLTDRGARFAADLGRTLARFHAAIDAREARGLGLAEEDYAISLARADAVIRAHVDDPAVLRAFEHARAWLANLPPDPVLAHGDPHLYNMFVDEPTGALRAIIDYGDIRIAHRADDLRYLHSNGTPFVRVALAAYTAASRVAIDEDVVGRYHVFGALEHFAFVAPDAPRFPEIIAWSLAAIRGLAPDWAE